MGILFRTQIWDEPVGEQAMPIGETHSLSLSLQQPRPCWTCGLLLCLPFCPNPNTYSNPNPNHNPKVAVVAGLVGVCLIALLCNSVAHYFTLSMKESRVVDALDRWSVLHSRESVAREVITAFLKYAIARKKRVGGGVLATRLHMWTLLVSLEKWGKQRKAWNSAFKQAEASVTDGISEDVRTLVVSSPAPVTPPPLFSCAQSMLPHDSCCPPPPPTPGRATPLSAWCC
jgi:hypothetical protein